MKFQKLGDKLSSNVRNSQYVKILSKYPPKEQAPKAFPGFSIQEFVKPRYAVPQVNLQKSTFCARISKI